MVHHTRKFAPVYEKTYERRGLGEEPTISDRREGVKSYLSEEVNANSDENARCNTTKEYDSHHLIIFAEEEEEEGSEEKF